MRDPLKQLVFDTRVIEQTKGVRLVLGQVVKDSHTPLTQPDKPWEDALDNVYPNLIYDEQDRLFKLWHKCVLDEPAVAAKQESPPILINGVAWYLCYATSRDGIAWKEELHDVLGTGVTSIFVLEGDIKKTAADDECVAWLGNWEPSLIKDTTAKVERASNPKVGDVQLVVERKPGAATA